MENGTLARVAQFVRKEKFILIALACFLIALPLIFTFSYPLPHKLESIYFGKAANKVTQGIAADKQYVFQQMAVVAASPDLAQFIQADDVLNVLSTLQNEGNIHKLDALTATDKNGIVLARTQVTSRRGDYLFQTTDYGQKVAEGTTTVSIEQGTALPLLVIAGFPVDVSGTMIGAVFGGYSIDDAYAHAFRTRYLSGDTNLIFYSKANGVIGTTFENPKTKALLAEYFTTGSDWVAMGQSDQDVIIEGKSYFVENVSLPGLNGSAGGVMILYPDHHVLAAVLSALFGALVFFFFILYFHTREAGKRRRRIEYAILYIFSIVIFVTAALEGYSVLYRSSIVVQKPPYTIYNSNLTLEPDSGIFDQSIEQQIAVRVSTGGEAINAAQIYLTYDPSKLRVVDILTDDSFCSPAMFLEKNIDNQNGEVEVACAAPSPGLSGDGTVVDLDVQGLQGGEATLHFASGTEILANDGLGTDVLRLTTDGSYQFVDEQQPVISNGIASALVFSPTDPNSARWYNGSTTMMTWLRSDGEQYRYALDQSPTIATLDGASTTDADSVTLSGLADGIWYFHIAPEVNGVIGPISDYKVMIDTTPPAAPIIQASQTTIPAGQTLRLTFESSPDLSGLVHNYYIKFDDGVFLPTASPLYIALPEGPHVITVRAFDNAGNFTDANMTITVAKSQ